MRDIHERYGRRPYEYLAHTLFLVHEVVRAAVLIEQHELTAAFNRLSHRGSLRGRPAGADGREVLGVADRRRKILQIEGYIRVLHASAALGADIQRTCAGDDIFAPIPVDVIVYPLVNRREQRALSLIGVAEY